MKKDTLELALEALAEAFAKFDKPRKEKFSLIERIKAAEKELEAAIAGPSGDEADAIIAGANQKLSVARYRLAQIARQMPTLLADFKNALRQADEEWSLAVRVSANIVRARFIKHNAAKFFKGDTEAAKCGLHGASIPGADDVGEKLWKENRLISTASEEVILHLASRFVTMVSHYQGTLLTPEMEP